MDKKDLEVTDEKSDYIEGWEKREDYIKRCLAEGLVVVFPAENELQVDIDNELHYAVFQRALVSLRRNSEVFGTWVFDEKPSRSGLPRRHITVTLPFPVSAWQRIAMQAALGSDPLRELLSVGRMLHGDPSPTVFTEAGNA